MDTVIAPRARQRAVDDALLRSQMMLRTLDITSPEATEWLGINLACLLEINQLGGKLKLARTGCGATA